jgi:hypothetical protein
VACVASGDSKLGEEQMSVEEIREAHIRHRIYGELLSSPSLNPKDPTLPARSMKITLFDGLSTPTMTGVSIIRSS